MLTRGGLFMAKKALAFKNKVISQIKRNYDNANEIISLINDDDICFAVNNGFSVESYIWTLVY